MMIKVRSLTGQEYEIDLAKDRKVAGDDGAEDVTMQREGDAANPDDAEDDGVTDPMQLTIQYVKGEIEKKTGVPWQQQRLIYGGKQLLNEHTLEQAQIEAGATLHLVLALRGGSS